MMNTWTIIKKKVGTCKHWLVTKISDHRWLVAGATVVYAIVAVFQWCALRENNRIINNTFIYNQRASISYTSMKIIPVFNLNNTGERVVRVAPEWVNSGNTPTKNLRLHFAPIVKTEVEILDPPNFKIPEQNNSFQLTMGPREPSLGEQRILTLDDLIQIMDRKIHVIFWGKATYNDVFQNRTNHVTWFCERIIGIGFNGNPAIKSIHENLAKNINTLNFTLAPCNTHNCSDEDCKDY